MRPRVYQNRLDFSAACPQKPADCYPQATTLCSWDVATPERYRWASGIPRNLSVWPDSAVGDVAASQVHAGDSPEHEKLTRYYRHCRTGGVCRPQLVLMPAHKAS